LLEIGSGESDNDGARMMPEENDEINLLLHQTVRKGDLITIRKDGAVLLNGREQPDATMELM
jgi:hypothetical protein